MREESRKMVKRRCPAKKGARNLPLDAVGAESRSQPVGMALDGCRRFAGSLLQAADAAQGGNAGAGTKRRIVLPLVCDRQIVAHASVPADRLAPR
jgi:hypothetical protein